MRCFKSLVLILLWVATLNDSFGAVTTFTDTPAFVRVPKPGGMPGEYINKQIDVACSGTDNTGANGKAGCGRAKYDYSKFTAVPTFPQVVGGVTYTAADNQRYWDWVYAGYGGGGACDWTQNCHGYGFSVGDWPFGSSAIISDGTTDCWVQDASNATIADNGGHTVKIKMKDCMNSIALIIETSSEQFRESGTYTGVPGSCNLTTGGSLDLSAGNGPREGLTFARYKKP